MHPFRAFLGLCLITLSACDNPESTANQLYVEASTSASRASSEKDPLTRYTLLQSAARNVQRITTDFSSTPAALRIAANENIGPYTRDALRQALDDAASAPDVCAHAPTRDCFLRAVSSSIDYISTHPRTEDQAAQIKVAQAVTGWPYLRMWQGIPPSLAARPDDLKQIAAAGARQDSIPFLLNIYETRGVDAAVNAIRDMANDDTMRDGLADAFRSDAPYAFAQRRRPTSHADLTRMANALYGDKLPEDLKKSIDDKLCSLNGKPRLAAVIVADCPTAAIAAHTTYYKDVPSEVAERHYEALAPADRQAFAKKYFESNYSRSEVQLAWLDRAGLSSDTKALASLCINTLSEGGSTDARLLKLLRAAPDVPPASPLASAGLTEKNLCLIHAGGAFEKQMPAILQNLRATPQITDETSNLLYDIIALAKVSPDLDLAPLADTIATVTAKWPDDDSRKKYRLSQFAIILEDRDIDPLPFLQRIYGADFLTKLRYEGLINLKRHGHADLYDKAMASPGKLDDASSLAAQALSHRLKQLHAEGDARGFVDTLATLPQNDRFWAIRYVFRTNTGPLPRDKVVQATIDRFPAEMLILQRNLSLTQDFGLTPEEQVRLFIAHPQEVFSQLDNKNDLGWVQSAFPGLTEEERIAAIEAVAKHVPFLWMETAGWYLLAQPDKP